MSNVCMNLSSDGNTWDFTKETITVGRSSTCDLCLSEPNISRAHAVFHYDNGSWYLKDLGSTNGTWINGNRLEPNKTVHLHEGARIDFGNAHQVVFHKGPSEVPVRELDFPETEVRPLPPSPPVPSTPSFPVNPPLPANNSQPADPPVPNGGFQAGNAIAPLYGQPSDPVRYDVPAPQVFVPLRCQRNFWKVFFLSLITFGIYGMVVYSHISREINTIASPYDGRRTMHFMLALLLICATFGVFGFIWMHKLCGRIRDELQRRGAPFAFGPKTFWLWGVLGSFIVAGTFIFGIRLMRSMNYLAADYNAKGY